MSSADRSEGRLALTKMRTVAKEAVYGLALSLRMPRLIGAHRGGGLIVLTYHSVGPQTEHLYLNRMPPQRFAAQMRYLKAKYDVVSVPEGLARLGTGGGSEHSMRPTVAVTVDDGYSDCCEYVHPIAQSVGVPITVFLATDYLDSGKLPWPTRVDAILTCATKERCEVPDGQRGIASLPIATVAQKIVAARGLREMLSKMDRGSREAVLADTERAIVMQRMRTLPPLTWKQVREMQDGGVVFGSHTRSHAWLDRVAAGEVIEELAESKTRIEAEIGRPCEGIAYPNGNHSASVQAAAANSGYRYALTQERGINRPGRLDAFALRRIEVPFCERLGTFACRVAGLAL